jgi:Tol biopolymer transport system component
MESQEPEPQEPAPDALIEEARRRARRRRLAYVGCIIFVALGGLAIFALVGQSWPFHGSAASDRAGSSAAPGSAGSRIAFVSFPAAHASEIIVINADGSGKHTVVRRPWRGNSPPFGTAPYCPGSGVAPSWSPDGKRLVFAAPSKGRCNDELYVVNADGSGLRRLTRNAAADEEAAWSPDGRKIAFISRRDRGAAEIYVMNADGTGQRRLTRTRWGEGGLAWSPDGTKIAFTGTGAGKLRDVYVMNADGTHPGQLTATATAEEGDPIWSPDGRQIAYVQSSQLDYDPISRIYVMNADGSGSHPLSSVRVRTGPSWSPDGRKLVFGGPRGLYVAAADGSGLHRLAKSVFPDVAPVWSPDGRKIAFLGGLHPFTSPSPPPAADLYVINADGTGRLNLTRTPEVDDGWSQAWAPG